MPLIYSFFIFLMYFSSAHPYYVSIWEIELNKETQTAQVTCKVFINDLEDALKKKYELDSWKWDNPKADSLSFEYIKKQFHLKIGGENELNFIVLGKESELDVMYIYLESNKMKSRLENVEVFISVPFLTESIRDQINIVHFIAGDFKKSSLFHKDETDITFNLSEFK